MLPSPRDGTGRAIGATGASPVTYLAGSACTRFGDHGGRGTLDLMAEAADAALADAGIERGDVDGLLCGYSTTMPHIMLATVFAEHLGLRPRYCASLQLGGATGLLMAATAHLVVEGGGADRVLIVAGENRRSGQTRDASVQALAQAGHPEHEVVLGATIPAYYGLVASAYLDRFGATEADLAELAVVMRRHASTHPGAHFREAITVADVMASRPVAEPLKLLDCCPVSDGGAAAVLSREALNDHCLEVIGTGQAHTHQHLSAAPSLTEFGAGPSAQAALEQARVPVARVRCAGVYDSFTITLAILLEELGLASRGASGRLAAEGHFSAGGPVPLNTHGGLLSYGHCGVAGAMAHVAELHRQMTGRAGDRQVPGELDVGLLHGDGGVLSSHVTMVVAR